MASAFFLFGDGGFQVEPTLERAAGYMEPTDVRNGEYDAVFDESGRCYAVDVVGETTRLSPTDEIDLEELLRRLRGSGVSSRLHLAAEDLDDPLAIAAAVWRFEWDHRWPKRPRWFSRLLHGDGPKTSS